MEWPIPNNKWEVQSFLRFTNFYQCFIEGFSDHTHPLFDLTKKDVSWKWGEEEQAAFDKLKQQLITSAPILTFPDNSHMYRVEANTDDEATTKRQARKLELIKE
jgi:hypothetical protein